MPDFLAPKARPIADIYAAFREPIPARLISQKDTGRFKADYVHHAVLRDLLDFHAPGWEWDTRLESIKDTIYCIGVLTIHGADASGFAVSVSRSGMGNENDEVSGYGDPSSNSEAQAPRLHGSWLGPSPVEKMSTYQPHNFIPGAHHNKRRADARTRGYRRRIATGETIRRIADAEGLTPQSVQDSIDRRLPEDVERQTPRGATHGLTRGIVAYALNLPPYAL